jgi:hypothetical protein
LGSLDAMLATKRNVQVGFCIAWCDPAPQRMRPGSPKKTAGYQSRPRVSSAPAMAHIGLIQQSRTSSPRGAYEWRIICISVARTTANRGPDPTNNLARAHLGEWESVPAWWVIAHMPVHCYRFSFIDMHGQAPRLTTTVFRWWSPSLPISRHG